VLTGAKELSESSNTSGQRKTGATGGQARGRRRASEPMPVTEIRRSAKLPHHPSLPWVRQSIAVTIHSNGSPEVRQPGLFGAGVERQNSRISS